MFPLAALMTIFVCVRDWRGCIRDRRLTLAASLGLAGFIGCFPRPDMVHIGFAAPLAFPLLACCMTRPWAATPRGVVAAVVVGLCVPSILASALVYKDVLQAEVVPTPRGDVAFLLEPGAPEMLARIAATPPGEACFFYPYIPLLPFLAAREHAARNDIFMPGYTTPSQYRAACRSVMRRASWVVIDRNWTNPTVLQRVFPAMRDARPRETERFEQALDTGFALVAREGSFELLHRRADVVDSGCAAIAG